ncbi:MAG: hypothetical protein EDM03_06345 [Porphyrobacter sp. IPPAS B-1204]|nr:MAG: hypothetical protein EDM03_06345 [Porphyrobacter sp. IPPAS B-1204]
MIRYLALLVALSLTAAVPSNAADKDISVAEFLEIWNSIDGLAINKEIEETGTFDPAKHPAFARAIGLTRSTGQAYRERIKAERAAGITPHSCLPESEVNLESDVVIPHLRSYAPDQRQNMTLAEAFADLMARTYPCP